MLELHVTVRRPSDGSEHLVVFPPIGRAGRV